MQKMPQGTNGSSRARPASSASSASSGSSSKHVKCIGRYVLTGSTLGKGNFARVEAAVHTLTRSKVAVKIIETDKIKEEYVRKNLLREAQLMRRLRHPNIIRLYETMKTSNLYCLVTEVAEGGELLSYVRSDFKEKRLSEAVTRPFIRQLVSALHHLHSSGIVHRDLKMENILLDRKKKQVKIVDFGLSNAQRPGSLLQTHCGSPEYAAPELFIPGREYGPEVDVWSLGVNMYAMLVGKLPFRSPRQGTKKRQKLLEQIQAGLTDSREKDMSHVTMEGRDLIGKLLQPNPQRRIKLRDVMEHPWITKDGSQPLYPYKYIPPDQSTQHSVMELMSTFLEVSQSEIRDAVRRDRCDWMAAIYNLLMDQPDGRVVMQRLLTSGPEEQLVDAAHYQGTMEHFRLSQDTPMEMTSPDVTQVMTAAVAGGSHSRAGHRHSIAGDTHLTYPSSTLPLSKPDKKWGHESRPLGLTSPQQPLNPVQPPPSMRRASVATANIVPPYNLQSVEGKGTLPSTSHSQDLPPPQRGRRLPVTPNEEPYSVSHDSRRPHSRAESEPTPLPLPWRPSIVQKTQLKEGTGGGGAAMNATSPTSSPPHVRRTLTSEGATWGNLQPPTQLVSPLAHIAPKKKAGGFLRPVRPISGTGGGGLNKKISGSVDAHLDSRLQSQPLPFQTVASGRHARGQVGPLHFLSNQQPMVGWGSNSRMGSLPRRSKDIQALMQTHLPTSPYSSVQDISTLNGFDTSKGSITSVDIKHDMFSNDKTSPQGSNVVSPLGSRVASPHGNARVSPHESMALSVQGGMRISPHGSTRVSPQGSMTVSPHGSTRISPHGSTRVSPHGSTTVSPHQSMQFSSPEGSKVMSLQPSAAMVKSYEDLKADPIMSGEMSKSRRRHRSISANPVTRLPVGYEGQSSDSQPHNPLFDPSAMNGGPSLNHAHKSHRRHRRISQETKPPEARKSGTRRHTHCGTTSPSPPPSYLTEL